MFGSLGALNALQLTIFSTEMDLLGRNCIVS